MENYPILTEQERRQKILTRPCRNFQDPCKLNPYCNGDRINLVWCLDHQMRLAKESNLKRGWI
ncbi:MAG: hypothetical protein ABIB79_02860 [archaeon]